MRIDQLILVECMTHTYTDIHPFKESRGNKIWLITNTSLGKDNLRFTDTIMLTDKIILGRLEEQQYPHVSSQTHTDTHKLDQYLIWHSHHLHHICSAKQKCDLQVQSLSGDGNSDTGYVDSLVWPRLFPSQAYVGWLVVLMLHGVRVGLMGNHDVSERVFSQTHREKCRTRKLGSKLII